MTLSTHDLIVSYRNDDRHALDGVSIAVSSGRTLAVVGPSGAGKTTLLRAIAGLQHLDGGDVVLDGRSIAGRSPQARRIALVFQDDALFANMTVQANLRFALRSQAPDADAYVAETAAALHIAALLARRPRELSGGERQRASMARALLSDPKALLMDEPLAHLDPSLRRSVRDEVIGVRERFPGPIVYVTHDHAEAMGVGDELAVLVNGRIEDAGDPQRVYDAPRTIGVARFLGERPMNLLPDSEQIVVGIRPEHVRLVAEGPLRGRIVRRESTGADAYVLVETPRGDLTVRVPAGLGLRANDVVALDLPPEFVRRFDRVSGIAVA
ncbi:MAG: ABC transporter ATP-binding protein [Candidatus Tumulicola sp.]